VRPNRKWKIKDGDATRGGKTWNALYWLVCEIETKFKRLLQHLLGPAIQRKYFEYCTSKPEMENPKWRRLSLENNRKHVYWHVYEIEMKFNGYGYILEVQQSLGNTSNIVLLNRKWKIQDGGHKIWKHVKRISRLVCEIRN